MINYNGRMFRGAADSGAVVARYHQHGELVWADFTGAEVRRGAVNGICDSDGKLRLAYSMVLVDGELVCGYTLSTPERGPGGRILLREEWQRYGANAATGISYLEEAR
jgi:hypothetical protein